MTPEELRASVSSLGWFHTIDLGNDPLAYADRQLKLGRELWQITETRALKDGEQYALLRRNFRFAQDCETGVEIDPRECTPEQLDALAAGGFNRLTDGPAPYVPAHWRLAPVEVAGGFLATAALWHQADPP